MPPGSPKLPDQFLNSDAGWAYLAETMKVSVPNTLRQVRKLRVAIRAARKPGR